MRRPAFTDDRLWVSAISAWEVALLVGVGLRAAELPDPHPDPVDRMIVASAELLGALLVTRDERLQHHAGVQTL